MTWKRTIDVIVPCSSSRTGVGIGIEWTKPELSSRCMGVWALSPCCEMSMCYKDGTNPDIMCDSCHRTYRSFPNLTHDLLHKGPLFQVIQYDYRSLTTDDAYDIEQYIERWTGLTGIEFSITL